MEPGRGGHNDTAAVFFLLLFVFSDTLLFFYVKNFS